MLFVLAAVGSYYFFVWKTQHPKLLEARAKEDRAAGTRSTPRQRKAANLEAYQQQLADIEKSFGAMLRQLPGKTEVPNLLVDISQTGLAAGLEEKLFQPQSEIKKDFYAELPIRIRLTGSYHEMGEFVSGIAALPRIVTLHDIEIKPAEQGWARRIRALDARTSPRRPTATSTRTSRRRTSRRQGQERPQEEAGDR